MNKTYEQLTASIAELAQAERVTKRVFGELSRDLLSYVLETEDVRPVNALLGVGEDGKFILTAANWRIGCMYFNHFIPFTSNFKDVADKGINQGRRSSDSLFRFDKKSKKRLAKCAALINEWLLDEDNTIWVWQADNVSMTKPKDYAGDIQKAITKALTGDDDNEPLSVNQVLDAVMSIEAITAEALFAMLNPQDEKKAA